MRFFLPCVLVVSVGCYASRVPPADAAIDAAADAPSCGAPITCVARTDDACARPVLVDPVCDLASGAWACPASSRRYERADRSPTTCLPYHDDASGLFSVGGSLARVPTDAGRCLLVIEDVVTRDGRAVRNAAIEEDLDAPFGSCPTKARFLSGAPIESVVVEGHDEPDVIVQITGAFRTAGRTRVLYRLFRFNPGAVFGVDELGTGFGRFDSARNRIVVGDSTSLRFDPSIDLGDGATVDDGTPYVFGCPAAPAMLREGCVLARLDADDRPAYVASGGTFTSAAADATRVFRAGPWMSALFRSPRDGAFVHVYAPGFGTTLERDHASSVRGPYAAESALGACDLPARDREAYCAGPAAHEERFDPTRPGEVVVSHSVGTVATDGADRRRAHPEDYWLRWLIRSL